MPTLTIVMDATEGWPELRGHPETIKTPDEHRPIGIGIMPGGMKSGKPSVFIRFDMADGTVILGETSAALFATAGRAIMAKYPDLLD